MVDHQAAYAEHTGRRYRSMNSRIDRHSLTLSR
jgi:hypothetical protein